VRDWITWIQSHWTFSLLAPVSEWVCVCVYACVRACFFVCFYSVCLIKVHYSFEIPFHYNWPCDNLVGYKTRNIVVICKLRTQGRCGYILREADRNDWEMYEAMRSFYLTLTLFACHVLLTSCVYFILGYKPIPIILLQDVESWWWAYIFGTWLSRRNLSVQFLLPMSPGTEINSVTIAAV